MAYCEKCGFGIGSQGHQDYCVDKKEEAEKSRRMSKMATDINTITALEEIKDAIKVLNKNMKKLTTHIAQQKRQPGWDAEAKRYGRK